jgi:hypothetical protein
MVNVNGTRLTAGAYHGTITFKAGSHTQQVGVALTVNVPPTPSITMQTTTLNFTTYKGFDPTPQTFTLSNTGNAPLNWKASEDGNGATFAPVTPSSGQVQSGKSVELRVSPHVAGYGATALVTTITVADTDPGVTVPSQNLSVTITILDQAAIILSDNQLNLTNTSTSHSLGINNSGSADLHWTVKLNETDATSVSWLSVDQSSGTLTPGAYVVITVQCDPSQLSPGTYSATLTVSDSDTGSPVAPQSVQITLVVS